MAGILRRERKIPHAGKSSCATGGRDRHYYCYYYIRNIRVQQKVEEARKDSSLEPSVRV